MPKRRNSFQRRVDQRPQRQRFLIVCEGERTEPFYFKPFESPTVHVEPITISGGNPSSLVEEAIKRRSADRRRGETWNQVWCVFDRDDTPAGEFNAAIQKAENAKLRVAYSNEAFELWYLLHFAYHNVALHRKDYCSKLDGRLGRPYQKNDRTIHARLLDMRDKAIERAEKLLTEYSDPSNAASCNPSTTVHLLVKELITHGKK